MVASAGGRPARMPDMSERRRSTAHAKGEHQLSEHALVLGPELFPVERPICAMAEDIRAVRQRGHIYILCGEAHPYVYNAPEIIEALRFAHDDRQATIVVLTGPMLLVPDGEAQHNGLITLFDDRKLTGLYHRPRRLPTSHFRVVETESYRRYYSECVHPPLLEMEKRACENFDRFDDEQVDALATKAVRELKYLKKQAVDHKTAAHQDLLLITTPTKLGLLMDRAWERDLPIEYLDSGELRALQSSGEQWLTPIREYRERLKARARIPATI
jgi:hypothetical protein